MFSGLAPGYRSFNRWSSLGLDELWRRRLTARVPSSCRVLDVGCGTGDTALRLIASGRPCVGMDLSLEMLRASPSPFPNVQASAERFPFFDNSFDAVVSVFVLRNLHQAGLLADGFREAARVTRPGGLFFSLDLTRPSSAWVRWGHDMYVRGVVPAIGRTVFGARWPGAYLRRSIEALDRTADVPALLRSSGWTDARAESWHGGIVTLFSARKAA